MRVKPPSLVRLAAGNDPAEVAGEAGAEVEGLPADMLSLTELHEGAILLTIAQRYTHPADQSLFYTSIGRTCVCVCTLMLVAMGGMHRGRH